MHKVLLKEGPEETGGRMRSEGWEDQRQAPDKPAFERGHMPGGGGAYL